MLNNEDSHFNGKDPDYDQHTILDWSRDLGYNARGYVIGIFSLKL